MNDTFVCDNVPTLATPPASVSVPDPLTVPLIESVPALLSAPDSARSPATFSWLDPSTLTLDPASIVIELVCSRPPDVIETVPPPPAESPLPRLSPPITAAPEATNFEPLPVIVSDPEPDAAVPTASAACVLVSPVLDAVPPATTVIAPRPASPTITDPPEASVEPPPLTTTVPVEPCRAASTSAGLSELLPLLKRAVAP